MTEPLNRMVEWFTAVYPNAPQGHGKVVAYCDAPQVLIETPDGEQFWWRRDLTRDITCKVCGGTGLEPDHSEG